MQRQIGNYRMTALASVAALLSISAQAQESAPVAPVEMFYCDFREDKDMDDLLEVAEEFAEWAAEVNSYAAWIVTPQFRTTETSWQVGWLGSWPSGEAMGLAMDGWRAEGGELAEDFDEVISCAGHGLASSVTIHAPEGPPDDGVVWFMSCELEGDATRGDAIEAYRVYSEALRDAGINRMEWAFVPSAGGGEMDFDHYHVAAWHSYAELGEDYDFYFNGPGKDVMATDGVVSCDLPRVYDARLVVRPSAD